MELNENYEPTVSFCIREIGRKAEIDVTDKGLAFLNK